MIGTTSTVSPALRELIPDDLWHGIHRPPSVTELHVLLRDLVNRNADTWAMAQAGLSRGGDPLHLVTVRGGPLRVLVVGGPHPNENIGLAVLAALGRLLSLRPEASSQVSWYLMPCLDPDGARLNTWTQHNGAPMESYHRQFFRPSRADQAEWALPQSGAAARLPEAAALARVIDTVRPHVYLSLHNSDSGGTFLLTAQDDSALVPLLHQASARHDLPVEAHPSDTLGWPSPGPGVHVLPPPAQPPASAVSSVHYAHRRGARYALMPEMPMWSTSPHRFPVGGAARHLEQAADALTDIIRRTVLPPDSPFAPAVTDTLAIMRAIARSYRAHPHAGDGQDLAHLTPLRAGGMLLRALDTPSGHHNSPRDDAARRAAREEVDALFAQWLQAADDALRPSPYPLVRPGGFQLHSILAAADLLLH
ncbi:M14 family zinc carboxypeptidase [Streptomyces sp. NPDC087440]|uniref:M14 family zinc carboxypeptidase n=1 Tax=Streptomyces sp. NPDC087440 TaxID=3365790 RepID=UPI0038164D93